MDAGALPFVVDVPPPGGGDRHPLLAIVDDWADESAIRILATVRKSLPPHGRVVVVENVLPDRPRNEPLWPATC